MVEVRSNLGCMAAHELLSHAVLTLELAKQQLETAASFASGSHGFTMPGAALATECQALAKAVDGLAGAVMQCDNPEVFE